MGDRSVAHAAVQLPLGAAAAYPTQQAAIGGGRARPNRHRR